MAAWFWGVALFGARRKTLMEPSETALLCVVSGAALCAAYSQPPEGPSRLLSIAVVAGAVVLRF
ncbi:MAG: hypothetical protein LBD24_09340, partial [Spirochaetaceae bacterium]|nr:hypothetical protein [Spirochaetaceae bacterium]